MKKERIPINRETWTRFLTVIKRFSTSREVGRKARWLFLVLISFLIGINALNVMSSYVGRDFMTAIEDRNRAEFIRMALFWIGVFFVSTIVSVVYRYTEEYLGLMWRKWATERFMISYANHRVYHRLKMIGEIGNPDQRIADDIRAFSVTTLSFILMFLNGAFTVIAFSGVLWTISPLLLVVAVLYALAGTFLTFLFGRPLIRLNYDQLDKEANLRAGLIYLRGNAESVAISRREGHLLQLSLKNLDDLVANFRRIIAINRNVGFFTTGYNWMIQIIPALFIAPLFIEGKVQFGVITQSAIAFTQLLGAFSLIVTQFQSISSYTAVLARLSSLVAAGEREKAATLSDITFSRDDRQIAYEGLTLSSPHNGHPLIKALSLAIPQGTRVLILGQDESAGTALFYSTVGLWDIREGHIRRPSLDHVLLLTELPYLPPGTIRELLLRPCPEEVRPTGCNLEEIQVPEERILEIMRILKIESLVECYGGLDNRQHWENTLPLEDQQLLVVARLLLACPRFALLERPSTTLNPEQLDQVLDLLRQSSITYITSENQDSSVNLNRYDLLLEFKDDGAWICRPIKDGRIVNNLTDAA